MNGTQPTSKLFLVLSALGPDRAGLVAEISEYVTARGGNVENSRMGVLGAEFGVLLLVSGSADEISAIEGELDALRSTTGLHVLSKRTKSPEEHRRAPVVPCVITAEALDEEGIVHAVAKALHQVGVNIVSLETSAYEAPVTGSPLFRMEAHIDVPTGITIGKVRKAMDAVAEAENLDIDVRSLIAKGG